MSMRKFVVAVAPAVLLVLTSPAFAQQSPNLGKPISPEDLVSWDISIAPDGTGLPPGSGTVQQGEAVFAAKCQACHGAKGAALRYDAVRLHPAGNATQRVEGPHERRGLWCGSLLAQPQRHHRGERDDERAVATEGGDAEPGRIHYVRTRQVSPNSRAGSVHVCGNPTEVFSSCSDDRPASFPNRVRETRGRRADQRKGRVRSAAPCQKRAAACDL